ncbi:beta strand repeat-containing protein [Hymenobacter rubripertinctus]|uniref:T9SS C-terminal target domain-containing protein n=1 Tax=Hymenobacter rubripertinctus TaxID=2029981 RepID=A0A418QZ27_9BACT|nr:T9SS type A sorting domain-containing protein [Hymenobacter rubripertinctus]RIY10415.1 T9SS C-terminal target domain-containing protein [Hymenobacter rubripertinctus]
MKKPYLNGNALVNRPWVWLMVLFGLFAPFITQAQTLVVTPASTPASPTDYGSVAVGTVSTPVQYTVTSSGFNGPTIVSFGNAPSFEGSTDGNTYSQNVSIPATGGTFFVRFKPSAVGQVDENLFLFNNNGGFAFTNIYLRGTGTAGAPMIGVMPTALAFGSQQVNTTSSAMSVTVNATSLTAPITVTAPDGFQVSYNGSAYGATASIPLNGAGGVTDAVVNVQFVPTVATEYSRQVTFASTGATTRNVGVSGVGTLPPASLSASPTQLNFGTLQAGQVSATQAFTITGSNVTSNVTVSAPNGYLIRQGTSGNFVQTIVVSPVNNSVNATFQARFAPSSAGNYNSTITATTAGNGGASTGVAVTGTATAAPTGPFIVVNPSALDFGTVSNSGSAQTLAFSINAGNLTAPLVLTGSNNNIVFRDASAGGSFVNGPITITPAPDGTVSIRDIEVRLVAPVGSGTFTGTITASSAGAADKVVTITANSTGGNSTINVSGLLNQFSTVPGVASDVQTYTVSGTNLLQGITVAAPQYFQVSLNANFTGVTGTGNSFVIAQGPAGDVPTTTIYVRFLPPSALSTTSIIVNSSSPATSQAIQVNGTSEPTIQIANAFQEVRTVVINTKSDSQALTINAQRVLQPITITKLLTSNPLNPSGTQQFELSLDDVTFSSSVTLTPNSTTYRIDQPIYVRYAPTYLGTGQSTLQFQSNDFSNNSTQSFGVNDLLTGRSIDTEPTERSTATVTRNNTTATVTFNLPANYASLGFGEGRLIVASERSTFPTMVRPQDGVSYQTGNQTYGAGPEIAPGYFVVYSGSNNSVVIDGLDLGTTYYFYTFEYNNIDDASNVQISGAENYLTPPVPQIIRGIIAPSPLPVTLVSFTAKVKGTQVALTWVTAAELNNKQFEVQRSRDGRAFETIVTLAGKGTTNSSSTYNEADNSPLNGVSYYRLKQVDLDGTFSYSSVVTISFLKASELTMYPNPVEDQLTISLAGATEGMQVTVTDMMGRVITTQALAANGTLDMASLKTGTYLVTVGQGEAKVTRRIVKK